MATDEDKRKENEWTLLEDEEKRKIEALYTDLPPLPPKAPQPDYLVQEKPIYSQDEASRAFYLACQFGNLQEVRAYIEDVQPSHADRQYGLEKAAHAFQIEIVRYLMQEQSTKIHTRVFQTYWGDGRAMQSLVDNDSPNIMGYLGREAQRPRKRHTRLATANIFASGCSKVEVTRYLSRVFQSSLNNADGIAQNIFASGSPKLLQLLQAFLDNGWHPNQILEPPQEVAIHHVRCVQDTAILKLLLDHGADPTISRLRPVSLVFQRRPARAPVTRKTGDVLDMASKVGSTEAVDLLLAHGAIFEYGRPLHCLIEYQPQAGAPVDASRFEMAEHLVRIGEDINGSRDMSDAVRPHSIIPIGGDFHATPLSHAVGCRDWDFVEWLLENGADPNACNGRAFDKHDEMIYGLTSGNSLDKNPMCLSDLIQKVKDKKGGNDTFS
ncbi:hypothetical protein PG995_009898 [Apiospora arundinis]